MYDIPIDPEHYHVNSFCKEELSWGEEVYLRVQKRYKGLAAFVDQTIKPLGLNNEGKLYLMIQITLAFCYTAKNAKPPQTKEQLDKTVKTWLYSFLPYIVKNLEVARYSHPIQFEPIMLSCHYMATTIQQNLFSIDEERLSEYELFFTAECINYLRAIRSSLALLSIGDDVHGVAIYRGAMEIWAKIALASQFEEDYTRFKKFNLYLQCYKQNKEPLPKEMLDYVKKEPMYKKSPEAFLAYGWARNSKEERILTMRELLSVGLKNEEQLAPFLQLASEFTHEDYVGIGYDYISIRKNMVDIHYLFFKAIFMDNDIEEFLSKKLITSIRHLQNLADSIYTGEYPLPNSN